ncbi:hypothetical protein SEA_BENCZKOWSKI14_4 [Gordonia phage Benczkowski14]|uniref:Uncharacterized protein n=4 Tax=Demosthenesvirus TaxID=1982106 RepID=A0A345MCI8_9CAUD|nr:hypothetical protein FDH67_gp04 [Gordonia phage Katyusha]AMS03397.1 hypothetical protein SEA_KATYUSHA_4 [Gordonia phage Katyusha]AMS03714.1 hypothetical protein SEA_BENCZKOWSKI14_4 [Gordonia phage Benczkowski14]AXH68209.1 hypothetical protein SEA_TEATEALATTE_4 [Gordonia phage Teatealatte]
MGKPKLQVQAKARPAPMGKGWTVDVTVTGSDELYRGVCRARQNVGKTALDTAAAFTDIPRSQLKLLKVEYVD